MERRRGAKITQEWQQEKRHIAKKMLAKGYGHPSDS